MKPNTSVLRVDVPDDDSNPTTPAQPEALGPEPSSRSRPKYSLGALFATAAAKIGLGSRTPSRPGSKQAGHAHGVQRDSVNPLSRAAHAASYRRSIELNEQLPEQVKAKALPRRKSMRESFKKALGGGSKGGTKSEQNVSTLVALVQWVCQGGHFQGRWQGSGTGLCPWGCFVGW